MKNSSNYNGITYLLITLLTVMIPIDCIADDYCNSKKDYRKEAKQGNAISQFCLGEALYIGKGIKKNFPASVIWWKKSAKQGNMRAQYALSWAYSEGEGIKKNQNKAVFWLKESAEKGYAPAQYNLASLYHTGEGVTKNDILSYMWLDIVGGAKLPKDFALVTDIKNELEQEMTEEELVEAKNLSKKWKKNHASLKKP